MPQMYLYNTGTDDACSACAQWDQQTGLEDELPSTPNSDCFGNCHCYLEEIDGGDECADQGLVDCVDSEGFEFCGEEDDEGCGNGCWCTVGLDPQNEGEEIECPSPYWDPNCSCSDECEEGGEE